MTIFNEDDRPEDPRAVAVIARLEGELRKTREALDELRLATIDKAVPEVGRLTRELADAQRERDEAKKQLEHALAELGIRRAKRGRSA